MKKRLVIGISGATGAIYGIRMLEILQDSDIETHLVLSDASEKIIQIETGYTVDDVKKLAHYHHDIENVGACIASGSFDTIGMIVAPCSIKTLSAIANSFSANLLIRAADVTLKERRKLVLMLGESPFHKGHFRLMAQATDMGAIITLSAVSFYTKPETISDIVDQTVARTLNMFDIKIDTYKTWSQKDGEKAMDLFKKERGLQK